MSASERLPGPISLVPDDILRLIFLHRLNPHAYTWWRSYDWINLTQVCKRWKVVLLTNPAFFAVISMHGGSTSKMSRLLDLSGAAPLSVYLPQDRIHHYVPLLAPHMDRVRVLDISVRDEPLQHQHTLALLFSEVVATQLCTLRMDNCHDDFGREDCLNIAPVFTHSIPSLRDLFWKGAVDWTSPILTTNMCRLTMIRCAHAANVTSLETVQTTLRSMPLLEVLFISEEREFSRRHPPSTHGHGLDIKLPRLKSLTLDMPAGNLVPLSSSIRADDVTKVSFDTTLGPGGDHAPTLDATVGALCSHIERATTSSPKVQMHVCGMIGFAGAFVLTVLVFSLDSASEDPFPPQSPRQRLGLPIVELNVDGWFPMNSPYLPHLMPVWSHIQVEVLTVVSMVGASASAWCDAFRDQRQITALEVCAESIVSMLRALQQDPSFLPRLSYLLIRPIRGAARATHWLSELLVSNMTETFAGDRKLRKLWLQDDPYWPIMPEHLECLKSCSDTVLSRGGV
jgi:hypothetical protein